MAPQKIILLSPEQKLFSPFKAIAACVLSKNICLVHVQLRYVNLSAENIYQFRLYKQSENVTMSQGH
jgi:hypothetical protein